MSWSMKWKWRLYRKYGRIFKTPEISQPLLFVGYVAETVEFNDSHNMGLKKGIEKRLKKKNGQNVVVFFL